MQYGAIDLDSYKPKPKPKSTHITMEQLRTEAYEKVYVFDTYYKYLSQDAKAEIPRELDLMFRLLGEPNPLRRVEI